MTLGTPGTIAGSPGRDPIGRFVGWLLRDRSTGELVAAETPNFPALVTTAAIIVRWTSSDTETRQVAASIATIAAGWWGVSEATTGANPFRRLLGLAAVGVVVGVVARVLK
ncbi:hypothetical protein [Marisediminicola senii]|uniref:hypothetical protein n=1 Tax=Marisediminicola senii TaxID=2711233 RepID=UPI0013EB0ADB|nr:hypothetical protein [Marisediminicola senii]